MLICSRMPLQVQPQDPTSLQTTFNQPTWGVLKVDWDPGYWKQQQEEHFTLLKLEEYVARGSRPSQEERH